MKQKGNNTLTVRRREFMKICGSAAAMGGLVPSLASSNSTVHKAFESVMLVDENSQPIDPSSLAIGREQIFYYPLISTPCFLLRLDRPVLASESLKTSEGREYEWRGGVGEDQSIVAYSAICAHKMSHPSPVVSFIGYREDLPIKLKETGGDLPNSGVIQCCSEYSVYDPANGAKVVSGPAPQPLAAIDLEVRENRLYAKGVYGGTLFSEFIEKFGSRVEMELGVSDVAKNISGQSIVWDADRFTRQRIRCG